MKPRRDRKENRRKAAEERNAAWQALTDEQKMAELRQRPGQCLRQINKLIGVR